MQEYINLLGYKCRDKISGFTGVAATVAFDLYGCVQVILTPETEKDGKRRESEWFDAKRLVVVGKAPVMDVPQFMTLPKGKEIGAAEKPRMRK